MEARGGEQIGGFAVADSHPLSDRLGDQDDVVGVLSRAGARVRKEGGAHFDGEPAGLLALRPPIAPISVAIAVTSGPNGVAQLLGQSLSGISAAGGGSFCLCWHSSRRPASQGRWLCPRAQ